MNKHIKFQSKTTNITATLPTLETAFGKIEFNPTSVGTASVSTVSDKEFIRKMKEASKEDLFFSPDNYGQSQN